MKAVITVRLVLIPDIFAVTLFAPTVRRHRMLEGRELVIEKHAEVLAQWPYSKAVFLPNDGVGPEVGEIFRQAESDRL